MSAESMLFKKPVSILARDVDIAEGEPTCCGPDPKISIYVMQNGFKIQRIGKNFVAKTLDEAKDIAGRELGSIVADMKKKDK